MKLIVGLGNPGGKYEKTRHNVGFAVVDKLAEELGCPKFGLEAKLKSEIAGSRYKSSDGRVEPVILVKPQTYMNQSGEAVSLALNYYKDRLTLEDLWVVHDDVDLDLGRLKIQRGGGTGGHHGIESVVLVVGMGFVRFRFGVGRPKERLFDVEDFVLRPFSDGELGVVGTRLDRMAQAIDRALECGLEASMNQFNVT